MEQFDVVIVGGGPAGLSAALVLGRSCRKVLVCDAGNPRNSASNAMHGFLTRDGTHPGEFLQMGRKELECYGVQLCETTVTRITPEEREFIIHLLDNTAVSTRKVLLATGVIDHVPEIPGIQGLYGKSVHHCPYCDGWEYRNRPIAVYGKGPGGLALSMKMLTWSPAVILCTNGPSELTAEGLEKLERNKVRLIETPIARLQGTLGELEAIVFENGDHLRRRAMFFSTGNSQRSDLPAALGCAATDHGAVKMDKRQHTNVCGVYVAGDACYDSQYVIIAAGEGAKAAMAINQEMEDEDRL